LASTKVDARIGRIFLQTPRSRRKEAVAQMHGHRSQRSLRRLYQLLSMSEIGPPRRAVWGIFAASSQPTMQHARFKYRPGGSQPWAMPHRPRRGPAMRISISPRLAIRVFLNDNGGSRQAPRVGAVRQVSMILLLHS